MPEFKPLSLDEEFGGHRFFARRSTSGGFDVERVDNRRGAEGNAMLGHVDTVEEANGLMQSELDRLSTLVRFFVLIPKAQTVRIRGGEADPKMLQGVKGRGDWFINLVFDERLPGEPDLEAARAALPPGSVQLVSGYGESGAEVWFVIGRPETGSRQARGRGA